MSQDIHQWIAEIKSLQQQLADLQRDRESALESAANWRQLYNTEAQQRRTEAKLSQQMIDALKLEIQQLKADFAGNAADPTDVSALSAAVEPLQTVEELKQKLLEALMERDRLVQALKAEREAHAHTRQSLTTALGDTVDLLAKKRDSAPPESNPSPISKDAMYRVSTQAELSQLPPAPQAPIQLPEPPKTPSLQLPPTRPAPPRF